MAAKVKDRSDCVRCLCCDDTKYLINLEVRGSAKFPYNDVGGLLYFYALQTELARRITPRLTLSAYYRMTLITFHV